MGEPRPAGEPRPSIERLRRRKERHQQRHWLYRVAFGAVAVLVVLTVLPLVQLPRPGSLIVAIGLGMLALEFDRAERLLERILEKVEAATESLSRWQQIALLVLGVCGIAAWTAAALFWEIPLLPG